MEEIISVKQLSKSYGRLNAVQGLDLSVTRFGLRVAWGKRCRKKHHNRMYVRHKKTRCRYGFHFRDGPTPAKKTAF